MASPNLLQLNVDTLFESHHVAEIDAIHKLINTNLESKKEELRSNVGERYRDLLQAADTIAAMQSSAGTLIEQVDCINANCRTLNEQQLIGFKTDMDAGQMLRARSANKQQNNYFSTMVQIKLLTALPELIWSHLDQEHFYTAAELFIFSRHISTGLRMDANNGLMQHLSVAAKQEELLKPFYGNIKQCVLLVLEREELSAESAVDCLLALLLLEQGQLQGVLKMFLQLRCAAFLKCLRQQPNELQHQSVRERILASLKILYGTIELVDKLFMSNGLLLCKLDEFCNDANISPSIALMDSSDAQFAYMLPEIISNFHPKFEKQNLNTQETAAALEHWLQETNNIGKLQLQQLFDLIPSMQTIQELKVEALKCKSQHNFANFESQLKLKHSLQFYELQYVPLIHQRIRNIIQDSWQQAMHVAFETLQAHLQDQQQLSRGFSMWQETSHDLPLSLEQALREESHTKHLLMKTKGFDCFIIDICTAFDQKLQRIVSEMNVLMEEAGTSAQDKSSLLEFLRETAQLHLNAFLSKLKSLNLAAEQRAQLLFVIRCCVALFELCPNLKICLCQQSNWRQIVALISTAAAVDYWQKICLLFEEEILHFWTLFVQGILSEISEQLPLPMLVNNELILEDFTLWETITLDQKDELDNPLQSHIRIPSQPRISIQNFLFQLEHLLNKEIPQTLPAKVLQAFNGKLLAQLLSYYEQLIGPQSSDSSSASSACNQNIALQLYFDLRFLQSLFTITRDQHALNDKLQQLQNALKSQIDPFDFELFAEHIALNVKRCLGRLSCLMGILTPQVNSFLSQTTLSVPATSAQEAKDPNVLCLSSGANTSLWFPLLPIVTANNNGSNSFAGDNARMDAEKPTSSTTPTRKLHATMTAAGAVAGRRSEPASSNKSKSGAASFFGAMSQEWFR